MASRVGASSSSSGSNPPPASSSSSSGTGGGPKHGLTARSTADPVLRNALRYTISAREYAVLHKYVISRSRLLRRRAPSTDAVQRILDGTSGPQTGAGSRARAASAAKGKGKGKEIEKEDGSPQSAAAMVGADDFNARAVRHSLRVFVVTSTAMKLWEIVGAKLTGKQPAAALATSSKKRPLHQSPALRLSLSLSSILLLYRLLFRFFTRLRAHILDSSAAPFRKRNPRTAGTLTSPYAPAIGASLAGLALGVFPAQQMRISVAIYTLFRALEFGWNCAEDNSMVWGWEKSLTGKADRKRTRPWWWGSWMLQPLAFGQLLHAVVFDRDCFPMEFGNFIFNHSTSYLHPRPEGYPHSLKWPKTYEIVDSLAQMARLNWPPFISPVLFPNKDDTLPPSLTAIAPLTSGAHPLITTLSCAILHPSDPSCTRTFLTFWLRSFPPLMRFFLIIYSAMLLPRFRSLYHFPVSTLQKLLTNALRMSAFLTGAISTAWASICFFQAWFPRAFMPTQRFFLGGFLAGFWALIERRRGRGVFLYSARVSVDSLWKVGVKRRWWRAMKGGDIWVFVAALMLTGVVYERDARAIKEGPWRKGISWVRGEGWKDWVLEEDEANDDEGARREDD